MSESRRPGANGDMGGTVGKPSVRGRAQTKFLVIWMDRPEVIEFRKVFEIFLESKNLSRL
jgi:hypothetical protein